MLHVTRWHRDMLSRSSSSRGWGGSWGKCRKAGPDQLGRACSAFSVVWDTPGELGVQIGWLGFVCWRGALSHGGLEVVGSLDPLRRGQASTGQGLWVSADSFGERIGRTGWSPAEDRGRARCGVG